MNATSLYVSTCRLVLQANPEDPGCWADLYRLIPYLRQSLSCTVCGNLLIEPYTPTETNCQHHVCRSCKGGKKKLKPSCSWCKNYEKYVENVQLRILLQCYKKLCEYIINSSIYRLMCKTTASGDTNIANMTDLIQEGAGFKDEFKSNSGLSKSAYSILPCIYASASTQTITQAVNLNNDSEIAIDEGVSVAKSNLSNGSSIYSVTYAGSGNKMVIKRKAMLNKGEVENCENLRLIKGSNFKRPIHRRGNFRGRGRSYKEEDKTDDSTGDSNCTVSSNNVSSGRMNMKKKKLGCRCGNATASPGKLTCCGQRCPCYVDSKACLDCKCRGCRNPHTKEGQKVIRDPADSGNGKLQSPAQLQVDDGIPIKGEGNFTSGSRISVLTDLKSCEETEGSLMFETKKEITIVVQTIENIKDPKVKEVSVVVEFLGTLLNQLEHIPVVDNRADIQLTASITVEELNPQFLDSILSNPVLFTILDCPTQSLLSFDSLQGAPLSASTIMEDKRKESKTSRMTATKCVVGPTVLGICNLDIGSLATGKTRIKETLLVESDKKVLPPDVVSWVKLPKLVVVATTGDEPLLLESGQKLENVFGITVESVYNVPENIPEGSLFDASFFMPTTSDKTTKIKFPNGVTTSNPDFTCRKKWLSLSQLEGLGARAKHKISPDTRDVISELGENINVSAHTQNSKKTIQWNMWKNILMLKADVTYVYSKIMKYRLWPIEIFLSSKIKEQPLKDKSSKSDKKSKPIPSTMTAGGSDHFIAFLNLSPLLYPGVTKTRVAAQLLTYSQADLISKFGSEFILTQPQQSSTATLKLKALSVRSKASARDSEDKESPGVPVTSEDGSPTFIMVEVELLKPFTAKRAPEELEKDLRAYLSIKGIVSKKISNFTVVHDSFSKSILHMVSILTREYQNYYMSLCKNNSQEYSEPQFYKYLCKQKIFHQIKATLENKMLYLITEKFGKMDCYEAKIPEIYVYLVNEMHKITNRCTLNEEVASRNNYDNELWLYAEEAIEEEEYEMARDYLVLKLSRNTDNPDNWLDIAVCCVRLGAYEEAVEAVKEALSLDFHHQIGLLMYALLMGQISKPNIAEVAFQVLLTKYPNFIEGWSALHYFYKALNNTEGALIAFKEAKAIEYENKMEKTSESEESSKNEPLEFCLNTYPHDDRYDAATEGKYGIASFKDGVSFTEPLSWTINFCPPECLRARTTVLFLKLGFCEYAAMSLSEELLNASKDEKRPLSYKYYTAVNYYLQGRYEEAVILLQQHVKEYGKDCYLWSLIAHCYYKLENPAKAIACYEYVMESFNRPNDIHLIYLRIGFYYLQAEKYPCAKKVFLTACKYSPTPRLWKGVGLSCLMTQELEEAEIALSEANYLDDRDPETWAYLGIVNAKLRRLDLFKQCAFEAKRRGLKNEELINKIKRCAALNGFECDDLEF